MPSGFDIAHGTLGAVDSLFGGFLGSSASKSAARSFTQAAGFAKKAASLTEAATAITQTQEERNIFRTIGGQRADIAGAGLAQEGSAEYLLRASAQQGGLTHAIIGTQGQITEQGFLAEAAADIGQANQAKAQGKKSKGGGILGAVGSVVGIFGG